MKHIKYSFECHCFKTKMSLKIILMEMKRFKMDVMIRRFYLIVDYK